MLHNINLFITAAILLLPYSSHATTLGCNDKIIRVSVVLPTGRDSNVHLKDFTRINLDDSKIYPWFKQPYQDYNPDSHALDSLNLLKNHVRIVVFGGSWCSDTKSLLPKFYKTVEMAKIPAENIILIGVDPYKHSRDGRSWQHRIKRVPTFILYYDGKEIGRVVESVNRSIETDMLNVYHKAGY